MNHARLVAFGTALSTVLVFVLARQAAGDDHSVVFTIQPSSTLDLLGGTTPQSPGSLTAGVSGNFVVNFDPSTDIPTSLSFPTDNGYFQLDSRTSTATPGDGLSADPNAPAPANFAGVDGGTAYAWRNIVWNYYNAPNTSISGSNGDFDGTQSYFYVNSAQLDVVGQSTHDYAGSDQVVMDPGSVWHLTGNSATGDWSLTLDGAYTFTSSMVFTANVAATAHFALSGPSSNIAPVVPTQVGNQIVNVADVLGGSSTTGGVSVELDPASTVTEVSVQQLPGITSLTQAAVTAAQNVPVFALSTSTTEIGAPQIWNLEHDGTLSGDVTLVFNYDPSLLPANFDPNDLVIWHYNSTLNGGAGDWEWGGTVDTINHTIAFTTNSMSPAVLGVNPAAVPEPATVVLAGGGLIVLAFVARRRRRQTSTAAR